MKNSRTLDLASNPVLKFYTVEKLGEKRSLTPEGYLLCEEVPIARTGTMMYGPNEVPITSGPDGIIRVHREAEEVFKESYMASFLGKSVVDDHPEDDVNPENWKELTIGVVLNPRRGTGMQVDLLIADFLITDKAGIEAVLSGKREVSCGYNADYEEIQPGEGRQTNMIANHVALVEAGRCGPRCAIGDRKTISTGEDLMKTRDARNTSWYDRAIASLKKAIASKDEAEITKAMAEAEKAKDAAEEEGEGKGDTHIHVGGVKDEDLQAHIDQNEKEHQEFRDQIAELNEKIDAMSKTKDSEAEEEKKSEEEKKEKEAKDSEAEAEMEGNLAEEAPPGTQDKARKARDSAYLVDSFQETVASAEILVPGIRIPTCDKASNPKSTLDTICKLRRNALDLAYVSADGRGLIEEVHKKPLELSAMRCADVRTLFRAVVALKKQENNKAGRDHKDSKNAGSGQIQTIADINERNAKFYADLSKS